MAKGAHKRLAIDDVYAQRNEVAVALAAMAIRAGFKAWRTTNPKDAEGWRTLVFIDLPTGQVSWHFPDLSAALVAHLPERDKVGGAPWDGHMTNEKRQRVMDFCAMTPTSSDHAE